MGKKAQKHVVIDTCVARAAGGESGLATVGSKARDTLDLVREYKHRLVMNQELHDEWMRHLSTYSSTWYNWMRRRRLVLYLGDTTDQTLRSRIEQCAPTNTAKEELLKDCCLVEAALKKGETIISLDEKARRAFQKAAIRVGEISELRWLNPAKSRDQCHEWLRGEASVPEYCSLGALRPSKK